MGGPQRGRLSSVVARDTVPKMTVIFVAGKSLRKEQGLGV